MRDLEQAEERSPQWDHLETSDFLVSFLYTGDEDNPLGSNSEEKIYTVMVIQVLDAVFSLPIHS